MPFHCSDCSGKVVPVELNDCENFSNIIKKDRFTLYMIIKGSVSLFINNSTYVFMAPCVICLNDFDEVQLIYSHMLLAKSLSFNPSFININMTIERINSDTYTELVNQYDFFSLRPFLHNTRDCLCYLPVETSVIDAIDKYFTKMYSELTFQRGHLWSCRSRTLLMRIVLLIEEIYDDYAEKHNPVFDKSNPDVYISYVLEYIHTNYSNEIKLDYLCEMGMYVKLPCLKISSLLLI
jgi:hypothetical protein